MNAEEFDQLDIHAAGKAAAGRRMVVVPDLDEDLVSAMADLEEALLDVAAAEVDGVVLPAPLAGDLALEALRRIWDAVAGTQGRRAVAAGATGRLYAPDGRYEYIPLRLVDLDDADVARLVEAADALTGGELGEIVPPAAGELATRIVALLRLETTPGEVVLCARLASVTPASDVVLTPSEESAYQTLTGRLNAVWLSDRPVPVLRRSLS